MPNPYRIELSGLGDEAGASLEAQLHTHLELGWNEIELRSANGQAFSEWDTAFYRQACRALSASGVRVTAVASRIANWERPITGDFESDMEELKRAADKMRAIGARYIRVMSYPNDGLPEEEWKARVLDRFHRLTDAAKDEGVVLLHENCSGWAGTNPDNALELVETIRSPYLRLMFDTGNGIAYRYNTLAYLKRVWPYVEHVHIKDGTLHGEEAVYSFPGEGASQVRECLLWLLDHGYNGILAIEPHLHLIPHLKQTGEGADLSGSYIAYGRRLEQLLEELYMTYGPRHVSMDSTAALQEERQVNR
ncbi:sugar phosphate isomerase/epimerase family protein [Paenibacillus xylaniclasticus]|uniref:sugar phosphate isomerase/epimerase family protein n=1 Tax=Paenibacillus xylaniclasticus TaxID=588083 RepID=UPI000FDA8C75|nr:MULTISPECIES: sugar phosphate isomerase/epimerase family protein [Paenibacillus]GFN32274.1 xylose isomerase [Paenibacillus curdlanolyticus]